MENLLQVKGLKTYYYTEEQVVPSVDGVDFELSEGETLAIVGESGCGKSVTSLSIMGLVSRPGKIIEGEILYQGEDLRKKSEKEMRKIRGNEISMIFQEPMTSLNPVFTVGSQIMSSLSKEPMDYIAVCDWYYMTNLRLGKKDEAEKLLDYIKEDFDPGDNFAYFRRLLMYKGILKPEEVLPANLAEQPAIDIITMGFGLSNYYYYNGEREKAEEVVDLILKTGDESDCFFAFGYLAAMVDKKYQYQ